MQATEAATLTFDDAEQSVRDADLIVNATPVGMCAGDASPIPADWIHSDQVVLDMVYGGEGPTALLTDARAAGAVVLDGLGMLVGQGATAVDIWNQERESKTPRDVMRAAAEAEMARRTAGGGVR